RYRRRVLAGRAGRRRQLGRGQALGAADGRGPARAPLPQLEEGRDEDLRLGRRGRRGVTLRAHSLTQVAPPAHRSPLAAAGTERAGRPVAFRRLRPQPRVVHVVGRTASRGWFFKRGGVLCPGQGTSRAPVDRVSFATWRT